MFSFGDASFQGSAAGMRLGGPVVAMAATPDGKGYWLASANGGVFSFGDASFQGSAAGMHLGGPVVAMAATPDGKGYWLASANGGVFSFGDASFQGSAAGLHLGGPVVAMAATPDGKGYWLASANGGVFSFGDAIFQGSAAHLELGGRVVAMAATPDGKRLLARLGQRRCVQLRRRHFPRLGRRHAPGSALLWPWRRRPTGRATGSPRQTAVCSASATAIFQGSAAGTAPGRARCGNGDGTRWVSEGRGKRRPPAPKTTDAGLPALDRSEMSPHFCTRVSDDHGRSRSVTAVKSKGCPIQV